MVTYHFGIAVGMGTVGPVAVCAATKEVRVAVTIRTLESIVISGGNLRKPEKRKRYYERTAGVSG